MKVIEQNRLRVRPSQVYWGNHPLPRGADTWRTPPYRTPLADGQPNLQSQDTGNHAEAAT